MSKEKYNYDGIPVETCRVCLSLHILEEDGYIYCKDCGCTDIIKLPDVEYWETLYKDKYGKKLLNKKNWGKYLTE